jgi:superfamily II DNA or RNA helicase
MNGILKMVMCMSFNDGILYEHNIEAYIKLMEAIEKKGKACAIHTTGSGKMYLALKWLVDHREEPFTYVAPTNVILDKFLDIVVETLFPDKVEEINKYKTIEKRADKVSKLLGNNVNLLTYSGLMEKTKNGKKHLKSKRIVLDEFHHVGGEEWGKAVEAFLEDNQEAEVMGLSATPVRNDGKDMVEELFDGEVDSEITLEDALSRGILPVPNFI